MFDPVAARFAIVGFDAEQNVCVADPVGAAGVVTIDTVTSSLLTLSHPVIVCDAK